MRHRLALLVVTAVLVAGCGSVGAGDAVVEGTRAVGAAETATTSGSSAPTGSGGSTATTSGSSSRPVAKLDWQRCGAKLQCARLTVPKDYDDASKGTIELYLKRRPADRKSSRVGTLLVNPGGPGVPATDLVDQAAAAFSPRLLESFDITSWDPRGTGKSGQVQCVDDLDPYLGIDASPDTPAEAQALMDAAKDFAAKCEQRSGDLLPYISTEATARDLDTIRAALGEDKISYFGFSYGSELGAVWATMFPDTVRAAVLDGAADVNATPAEDLEQQTVGLERVLTSLLTQCSADPSCPINNDGKAGEAFDRIMKKIDTTPLRAGDPPREVNEGVAQYAVTSVLYSEQTWPLITQALAEADKGNGKPLLDLYDAYLLGYGAHTFEALIAIQCIDQGGTDTTDDAALGKELRTLAPRLGPYALGAPFCEYWPAKGKVESPVTGKGAGPIVVVGTTGDPVTPIEASTKLAASLEKGVLVTVQAQQHTGYGTSQCIGDVVDDYLISLTVPEPGKVCKGTA